MARAVPAEIDNIKANPNAIREHRTTEHLLAGMGEHRPTWLTQTGATEYAVYPSNMSAFLSYRSGFFVVRHRWLSRGERVVTTNKSRRFQVLVVLVTAAVLMLGTTPSLALFDMGFGLFNPVPSPTRFIHDHALIRAGAGRKTPERNVYANNPNSYINKIRDNGFSSHYGSESRRSPGFEVDRRRLRSSNVVNNNPTPPATVAQPAPESRPVYPIASFFDAARQLVWPSEAPVTDDLKPKRDTSDQACLVVKDLVEKHRSAPITTVTDARQRLLDYGQPALRVVRSVTTPRVAESFHIFLLSLYDSLAAAANSPEGT
jgi:hypothetical protein